MQRDDCPGAQGVAEPLLKAFARAAAARQAPP
jgi:hypothetical protein